MLVRSFAFVALIGLIGATGCAGKTEFKEISSAEGKFKVQMPTNATEKNQAAAGGTIKGYAAELKKGAYIVMYMNMPFPPGVPEPIIEKALDDATAGMAKSMKGGEPKVTKEKFDGKYPARSVEVPLPDKNGSMRGKIILVNGRLYQVYAAGEKDFATNADANTFLNSFTLLP